MSFRRRLSTLGHSVPTRPLGLGLAAAAAVVWLTIHLDQGWVPHDDGAFGQSATRVLAGEWPHRDFGELYTGGLTFLNAAVFAIAGEDLLWLRVPLLIAFASSLPAVYLLARRVTGRWTALAAAAVALTWGLPLYPAAVPSWYILPLVLWASLALLRFRDTGAVVWLVVAGVLGGLAVDIKIVGVWFLVAGLVFLLTRDPDSLPPVQPAGRTGRMPRGRAGLVVVSTCTAASALLVIGVIGRRLHMAELVQLVAPVCAVLALVVATEARRRSDPVSFDVYRRALVPFLAGIAVAVCVLALPFLAVGALDDLVHGVLVAPRTRLDSTYLPLPAPRQLAWAAPVVALFVVRALVGRWGRRLVDAGAAIAIVVVIGFADDGRAYDLFWQSLRALGPLAVLIGVGVLFHRRSADPTVVLMLLIAAFVPLQQFPFAAPIYFAYTASLVVLGALAVLRATERSWGALPAILLTGYAVFGLIWLDRSPLSELGYRSVTRGDAAILDANRASIEVPQAEAAMYQRVAKLLREHSPGDPVPAGATGETSSATWAGPDAPELPFLADLEPSTRSLFDFLEDEDSTELLEALETRGVNAIAINHEPAFSPALDDETLESLRARYPHSERIGKFEVRWLEAA